MDLLTLQTLAAHEPRRGIRDTDNDQWHAHCLLDWGNDRGPLPTWAVLSLGARRATVLEGEPRDCYDCRLGSR